MLALLLEPQILRKQTIAAVFFSSRSDFWTECACRFGQEQTRSNKGRLHLLKYKVLWNNYAAMVAISAYAERHTAPAGDRAARNPVFR